MARGTETLYHVLAAGVILALVLTFPEGRQMTTAKCILCGVNMRIEQNGTLVIHPMTACERAGRVITVVDYEDEMEAVDEAQITAPPVQDFAQTGPVGTTTVPAPAPMAPPVPGVPMPPPAKPE